MPLLIAEVGTFILFESWGNKQGENGIPVYALRIELACRMENELR